MESEGRKRGRPRVWETTRERQREQRQRKAAVYQAALELIVAALNMEPDDPILRQQLQGTPDDLTVLRALTGYCRRRHWDRAVRRVNQPGEERGPDLAGEPSETDLQ